MNLVASKEPTAQRPVSTTSKPERLLSLDLLRGLTIGFMILVNNGGSEAAYAPLHHAEWNGFNPTDLVFPTFLFLVGISTVLSTASRLARGATRQSLFLHTLRRAAILFALGIVVNSFPFFHLATMRFYGVLPRIAICYLIVSTLYIFSPEWRSKAAIAVAALVGYWAIMRFVPVPGLGTPTHDFPLLDSYKNLAAWLDRQIFSAGHLYERTRDPEGLLSTLPAVATALLGLLTGVWLRTSRTLASKARGIALAGVTCVVLGGLWNLSFPINKKLWTSSYVLFAGGLSLLLLALAIWVADVWLPRLRQRNASPENNAQPFFVTPLLVFGTNAIVAYVFSELLAPIFDIVHPHPGINLQQTIFQSIHAVVPDAAFASLLYSLLFVLICWLATYVLYRNRIFIKI